MHYAPENTDTRAAGSGLKIYAKRPDIAARRLKLALQTHVHNDC